MAGLRWSAGQLVSWSAGRDARLRDEVVRWLKVRTFDGRDPISREDLAGFRFAGERLPLIDPQRGIRKPAVLEAAITMFTTHTSSSAVRPYADEAGLDGMLRYKRRGLDSEHPDNVALCRALELGLPLIWLFGIGSSQFQAVFPVYLVAEEPAEHQFVVGYELEFVSAVLDSPMEAAIRRYVLRETKVRVHQPVFRATVMRAYDTRCAVCSLGHAELLDAAHIVPDSLEAGVASVTNGLALCRIHHAAYDRFILAVRPDYVVEIRHDLWAEIDGPMLEHGLKRRHGQPLMSLPARARERPDRELLADTYERFKKGSTRG